jgi:hypothetical protein
LKAGELLSRGIALSFCSLTDCDCIETFPPSPGKHWLIVLPGSADDGPFPFTSARDKKAAAGYDFRHASYSVPVEGEPNCFWRLSAKRWRNADKSGLALLEVWAVLHRVF